VTEAAKTLRAKWEATKAKGREAAKTKPAAPAEVKGSSAAPSPKETSDGKKPTAKVDPDLEAAERLLKQDRANKAAAKALEDERKAWQAQRDAEKAELDQARAVKAALAGKDPIGALKAIGLTEKDIYEGDDSLIFRLSELRAKKPELDQAQLLSQAVDAKLKEKADADAAAEAKRLEDAKAEAKKAQDDAAIVVANAKEGFAANVAAYSQANADKYPTLAALEIPVRVVVEYAWQAAVQSKGEISLTEAEALDQLEAHYAAKVAKTRPAEPPAKVEETGPSRLVVRPPTTVQPSWQATAGTPANGAPASLKDKEKALYERGRKLAVGGAS
jgi:hypothetical protein